MNNLISSDLYEYHHTAFKKHFLYCVEMYNTDNYKEQWDIYDWCDEHFGERTNSSESRWYISGTGRGELFFWCNNEEDAMAFKLRWI